MSDKIEPNSYVVDGSPKIRDSVAAFIDLHRFSYNVLAAATESATEFIIRSVQPY